MEETFEFLKNEKINKQDTYRYATNIVNENVCSSNEVCITFLNGKFHEANFDFGRKYYNRMDWRILKAIEAKITELEKKYAR